MALVSPYKKHQCGFAALGRVKNEACWSYCRGERRQKKKKRRQGIRLNKRERRGKERRSTEERTGEIASALVTHSAKSLIS